MAESISEGTLKQWSKRKSDLLEISTGLLGIDTEGS